MCKAHSDPISPSLKWKDDQGKRPDFCSHVPGPTAVLQDWGPLLDFSRAVLPGVGCHHWGPPLIWAWVLGPSNWSLLLTPDPREQDHSSLWLKGSNFKLWVLGRQNRKVRSWLPPRCMPFKKMTLSAKDRREEMISPYSFLSPSFCKLQWVPICQGCPAGKQWPRAVPISPWVRDLKAAWSQQSHLGSLVQNRSLASSQVSYFSNGSHLFGGFVCLFYNLFRSESQMICAPDDWLLWFQISCTLLISSPFITTFMLIIPLPPSVSLLAIYLHKKPSVYLQSCPHLKLADCISKVPLIMFLCPLLLLLLSRFSRVWFCVNP